MDQAITLHTTPDTMAAMTTHTTQEDTTAHTHTPRVDTTAHTTAAMTAAAMTAHTERASSMTLQ